jgi:prephenate dehydrogenase
MAEADFNNAFPEPAVPEPVEGTLAHCRVAIVGLGLMGGSLALALKDHCRERVGVDSSAETLDYACQHAVVERVSSFEEAVATTDLLILATPVRGILAYLDQLARLDLPAHNRPIVLDIGSTKTDIVAAMQALPPGFDPVGGHPMCGKETGGIQNAEAALYKQKTFVLCPLQRTSARALALAQEVVEAVGATGLVLDAERHDTFAALISHLPYTVAAALMRTALGQADEALWQMAASGFRDTTRLAASDIVMMSDILLTNRVAVLEALAKYKTELDVLTKAIESGDVATLRMTLEAAQQKRSELFK